MAFINLLLPLIMKNANFHSAEFIELCRLHKVREMYAFGSVLTDAFTSESDIDLLVNIDEPDPIRRGKLILSLYNNTGKVLNRKIDLLTIDSIKNSFLEEYIGTNKQLVYSA